MMVLSTRWIVSLSIVGLLAVILYKAPSAEPPPLLRAAYNGDLETIQRLLPIATDSAKQDEEFVAHVKREANVRDHWNNTTLHWAAKGASPRSFDVVRHLLAAGADAHAVNNGGSTALHWACTVRDAELGRQLITLFLERGVSINAANSAGETPLHWAVDWVRPYAVELLIERGANVNQVDVEGQVPLHKIKRDCDENEDCTRIVTLLVKGGTDVGLKNRYGRTPLAHFNQDKEQQRARGGAVAGVTANQTNESSTVPSSTPAAPSADQPPQPLSDKQIKHIQDELEEFKRKLAEGL